MKNRKKKCPKAHTCSHSGCPHRKRHGEVGSCSVRCNATGVTGGARCVTVPDIPKFRCTNCGGHTMAEHNPDCTVVSKITGITGNGRLRYGRAKIINNCGKEGHCDHHWYVCLKCGAPLIMPNGFNVTDDKQLVQVLASGKVRVRRTIKA